MIVNIAIIGAGTPNECAARKIGMKNAKCRGGTFTKKTKRGRKGVWLASWNYDGGRFWILFFSKEDPFEYLLREGLVGGRGDP